jgi:transposase InsO family protein
LNISVQEAEKLSLEEIRQLLEASEGIRFAGVKRAQVYSWIELVLCEQEYARQGKASRGLLRRYIEKMTGMSRAQVTRLIGRYIASGRVVVRAYRRHRFAARYTMADVELLASVDEAHETLSGPATRRILEREYQQYGKQEYSRLASISVSHIYNLRRERGYRQRRLNYVKTKPTGVTIAERRRPNPQGQPGYLRVDTVHQGDQNGTKGVFHINAVDEVTQWQIVAATERISEAWLQPVLRTMLEQFPFRILGFHSDNGSEFLNATVAKLLGKLLIEQTKSRPRQSNDNALVETKNGAVIRKHLGYSHIRSQYAEPIQHFYDDYFNPYLNFHRPCAQPEFVVDRKGRTRRIYRRYQTPLETLLSLPQPAQYLRVGFTADALTQMAAASSDTEAARRMQEAKRKLFDQFESTG